MKLGRKLPLLRGIVFALCLTALLLEIGSYFAVRLLSEMSLTRVLFYQQPTVSRAEYESYLERRDPLLGWPPPEQIGSERYDASGSRPVPSYPRTGSECVSTYGDSFTYASDVSNEEAWSNMLSQLLGCRVANFGVGGYGTDQAFIRFENNGEDRAQITILGLFPTNVIRNLTRNAYYVFGTYPTSFKPRYEIGNGEHSLLPIPSIPADELDRFLRSPGSFLPRDKLLPGTAFGPSPVSFPYTRSLYRASLNPRVTNWLRGRPSWMEYLTPGHASSGYEVLVGILKRFSDLCESRERHCMVLMFPTPNSYAYQLERNESALATVIAALDRLEIPYLDLVPPLAERLDGRSLCDVIGSERNCVGHFNAEGNILIAEIVRDYFKVRSWEPEK